MRQTVVVTIFLSLFLGFDVAAQVLELDSLRRELSGSNADTTRINLLNELAFSQIHKDPTVAKDDVAIALDLAEQLNYIGGQARALNVFGGIHWAQGDYPTALDYYFKSANTYESLGNRLGLAKCFNNIGEIYKKLDDWEKAKQYLFNALVIFEEIYGEDKALLIYNNIAEVYLEQDSLQQAEVYFKKILEADQLQNDRKLAYAYVGLGQIAERKGSYATSRKYYERALTLRERLNDKRGIADTYIKIGRLLQKHQLYDSAESFFDHALEVSLGIKAKDLTMHSLMGKTVVDSLKGNYQASLRNFIRYTKVKDSTFNEEKFDQLARMQTAYQTQLLRKENEANRRAVQRRSTLVIAAVMALFLCIIIAVAFYRQRQVQRQANRLLARKNDDIEKQKRKIEMQSAELEKLNRSLIELNESLEAKVKVRTEILTKQNEVLSQYAFINAHELRAPVANILGLVNILCRSDLSSKEEEIVEHLSVASQRLDQVIKDIRKKLEDSDAFSNISEKAN